MRSTDITSWIESIMGNPIAYHARPSFLSRPFPNRPFNPLLFLLWCPAPGMYNERRQQLQFV